MPGEESSMLLNRQLILEVIAAYAYTWDSKDPEGWANLFTEDAVWEAYGPSETAVPVLRAVSRAGLQAFAAQSMARPDAVGGVRHYQTGTVFLELTADTARTRTMFLITHRAPADTAPQLFASGIYLDTWQRTASGWQFAHRTGYAD